jgi:hypothetical protein
VVRIITALSFVCGLVEVFLGSWKKKKKKKKKLVSCAPEGVMALKVAAMAGLTGTGPFTISSRASVSEFSVC